ncbi:hypothetical protein NQ176_g1350 [Zarea fungicola]|uniref:Uncharacterized protein n=1 Tax=Zarea fungicola TaxID=93591 RepID=A0ACC1NV96_9HYPO|nr:hypothetical protein NQ176_g1350 [Lecanicillium fungicola]
MSTGEPVWSTSALSTRADFYAHIKTISLDDGGARLGQYLNNELTKIPKKEQSEATFVSVLMDLQESAEKEKSINPILIKLIRDMPNDLINEKGGKSQNTPLHSAINRKQTPIAEALLDRGPNLTAINTYGRVPLHLAAEHEKLRITKRLVEGNSDTTGLKDQYGETPFSIACEYGREDVIQYLLQSFPGAALQSDKFGHTPLYNAIKRGDLSVLRSLLGDSGAEAELPKNSPDIPTNASSGNLDDSRLGNPDLKSSEGCYEACPGDSVLELVPNPSACTMELQTLVRSTLNKRTNSGKSILDKACRDLSEEIITFLLNHGADPAAMSPEGRTCLWVALAWERFEIAELLIKEPSVRTTLNDLDSAGFTLLSVACSTMTRRAVSWLLEAGVDCSQPNHDGSTAITNTIINLKKNGMFALVASDNFRNKIPDVVKYKDESGKESTALHLSCQLNLPEFLKMFLEYGVEPGIRDGGERTMLHEASRLGNNDIFSSLLSLSKDLYAAVALEVDRKDGNGWTALHYASSEGSDKSNLPPLEDIINKWSIENLHIHLRKGSYANVISNLLKLDAAIDLPTSSGDSALHLAASRGHFDRTVLLLAKNNNGDTPLVVALKTKHTHISALLATLQMEIEFPGGQERDDLLLHMAKKEQTHNLLSCILSKVKDTNVRRLKLLKSVESPLERATLEWAALEGAALEWATLACSAKLVWFILHSSTPGQARDHSIKAAIVIIKALQIKPNEPLDALPAQLDAHAGEATAASETGKVCNDIFDMLHNPPLTGSLSSRFTPNQQPQYNPTHHPPDLIKKYSVELVESYNDSFLRRASSVAEAIYTVGPDEILEETWKRTQALAAEFQDKKRPDEGSTARRSPNFLMDSLAR